MTEDEGIGGPTVSLAEAGAQSHLSVATIRRRHRRGAPAPAPTARGRPDTKEDTLKLRGPIPRGLIARRVVVVDAAARTIEVPPPARR